jgi:Flp pilus assembly protein TadG
MMRWRNQPRDDERGFVLIATAALVTTLCLFAGLAIDFGSWYVRAAEIKRATDAAALAGVVWMPEFDSAEAAALATAARNGFVDGQDGISVSVLAVPNNNRQLRVTITDSNVDQFFSRLVVKSQSITRDSTAEYVLPVPLGSPRNTFGTDQLLPGTSTDEYFWAAVNGYCAGHESGDEKLARYESYSQSTGSTQCNNGSPESDNYDPDGYLYAINLPQNAQSLKLEVYDPAYNTSYPSGNPTPDTSVASGSQQVTTIFEIYDRNPTPLDLTNLTLIDTKTFTTNQNQSAYRNQWVRLYTWNNPQAGQYYLRVKTQAGQLNSRASNGFGIRAYTGSSFASCTTIQGQTGYSASCPQVHGVYDMSIFANGASTTAEFYLAQIDPVHAGKTMRVTLFDAGEGADTLRVIDPNGNPASFTWFTPCNPPTPPTGSCSGSGTSLSVTGSGTQPYTGLHSNSKYNDRYLIIDIPLPANYAALYGANRWWKIRYSAGSNPTDRTTWSVNIVGDPVHLVK